MVSLVSQTELFCLSLGTVFSEAWTINCGVTQGSILGPLLFLLYINDIRQALLNTHTYLYADDTSIFCQRKDVVEIENVLIKNLWMYAIRIKLNRTEQYRMAKYLSCCLDANLSWESMPMISTNPVFFLKHIDDAFQAHLCLLSSHV